jgi:hypothetical protein
VLGGNVRQGAVVCAVDAFSSVACVMLLRGSQGRVVKYHHTGMLGMLFLCVVFNVSCVQHIAWVVVLLGNIAISNGLGLLVR